MNREPFASPWYLMNKLIPLSFLTKSNRIYLGSNQNWLIDVIKFYFLLFESMKTYKDIESREQGQGWIYKSFLSFVYYVGFVFWSQRNSVDFIFFPVFEGHFCFSKLKCSNILFIFYLFLCVLFNFFNLFFILFSYFLSFICFLLCFIYLFDRFNSEVNPKTNGLFLCDEHQTIDTDLFACDFVEG